MKLCSLGSGSRGNCLAVWNGGGGGLLIDVGLSYRQMIRRMLLRDIDPAAFGAILLTHGHGDHAAGLRLWTEHHGCPVYCTSETAERIEFLQIHDKLHVPIEYRRVWEIEGFRVTALPAIHIAGALTFMVEELAGGARLAMLCETGRITEEMGKAAAGAEIIAIESNHDSRMLANNGDLPDSIIEWIAARHLSNRQCAEYLRTTHKNTSLVMLLHLSQDNNRPELALKVAGEALLASPASADTALVAEAQNEPGEVWEI